MKHLYLSFSIIILSIFTSPISGQNEYKKFSAALDVLENAVDELESYSPKDLSESKTLTDLSKKISKSIKTITTSNIDQSISDLIEAKFYPTLIKIQLIELSSEKNQHEWNDIKPLKTLKKIVLSLNKMKVDYSNKIDARKLFSSKINDKNNARYFNRLSIPDMQETHFDKYVWPFLNEQTINKSIEKTDNFIYEWIVRDESFRQLEYFLGIDPKGKYGVYSKASPTIFNVNFNTALMRYYEKFTQDGEPETIRLFLTSLKENSLIKKIFTTPDNVFKNMYEADNSYANEIQPYLTSNNINSKKLREIIRGNSSKEIAFLALQKLIKKDLETKYYSDALEKVESLEQFFLDSDEYLAEINQKKVLDLKNSLDIKIQDKTKLVALEGINTRKNNLKFFFSNQDSIMAVIDLPQNNLVVFSEDKDKGQWKKVPGSERELAKALFYWFDFTHVLNGTKIKRFEKQKTKLFAISETFPHPFTDVRIQSFNGKYIALFAAKTPYGRRIAENEGNHVVEHPSPWPMIDKLSLQENGNNNPFHGKLSGNANTDLYYAIYDKNNKVFTKAKHLGNIVNTGFSERSPFISKDGSTLYFSSEGHGGFGGFDIFKIKINISNDAHITISQSAKVEHMPAINTEADELFYQDRKDDRRYLSSNYEGSSFNLYEIEEIKPYEVRLQKTIDDSVFFEVHCYYHPEYKAPYLQPGRVEVTGKVFDINHKKYNYAELTFSSNVGESQKAIINKNTDKKYYCHLRANTPYQVSIKAKHNEADEWSTFFTSFIKLCDEGSISIADFISPLPGKKISITPFFFAFNKDDLSKTNTKWINARLKEAKEGLTIHKFFKIGIFGYADEIGEDSYNCELSSRRVANVKKYLLSHGFSEEQLVSISMGETDKFNKNKTYLYESLIEEAQKELIDSASIEYQSNRRVEVYIISPKKKHVSCQH